MMFIWIFILIAVIFFIWYVNRENINWPGNNQRHESPLDVLKKRFARGEINKEEYEEQKALLEED